MKLHQTAKALVARGIASDAAIQLANQGLTLAKLKQMSKPQLIALNLSDDFIKNIQSESRPPIDSATLDELLFESRFCCCVCRDPSKPIVLHHIEPWEKSHSHKKENLVVLCPNHHSEAHTKHDLTLTLTPERLRSIKAQWLQEVQMLDRNTICSLSDKNFACWDFFNLNRIFELSSRLDIHYDEIRTYQYLFFHGYIDREGHITPIDCWPYKPEYYWLDMVEGIIADKEFIVLVGPSGCGKTTTLRMVAGLEEITAGELYIDGKLMNNVEPKDRDISMVFQSYALYPHLKVWENISFPLKLRKVDKATIRKRVKEVADILDYGILRP